MGIAGNIILAVVCLVIEAIVFVLTVVATPLDVFRSKTNANRIYGTFSMWGAKRCGGLKTVSGLKYKGFGTSSNEKTMNAAAAFAIISIFTTLVALVLTVLLVCKCIFRVIPGIFSAISFITLLVSWACMAGVFHMKVDGVRLFSEYKLASAFGLMVAAWCLQTIEMVLVFFA